MGMRRRLEALRQDGTGCLAYEALSGFQRKIVHLLADELGLHHTSTGPAEARCIHVAVCRDDLPAAEPLLRQPARAELCNHFLRGYCRNGGRCHYRHA